MKLVLLKQASPDWDTTGAASKSASATDIRGVLDNRQEVLGLTGAFAITGKSTAGAFNVADGDPDKVVAQLCSFARVSYGGEGDAVKVSPDELRDISTYAFGSDPYAWHKFRGPVGQGPTTAIPATGGTAQTYLFNLAVPFVNVNKENPNVGAVSGAQLNRDCRLDFDSASPGVSLATLTAGLALSGGTIAITAVNLFFFAIIGDLRDDVWVAPIQLIRRRTAANNPDTEPGPFYDEIIFEQRDTATFEAANGSSAIAIEVDGKMYVKNNTLPSRMAMAYPATVKAMNANGYDLTFNAKNNAGTRTGRTVLVWQHGSMSPIESELADVKSYRTFTFGTTNPTAILVYWRITPITSANNIATIASLLADTGVTPDPKVRGLGWADLAIHGGGSSGPGAKNGDLGLYKPRILKRSRMAAQAAA